MLTDIIGNFNVKKMPPLEGGERSEVIGNNRIYPKN
jgi:hypothetical protein